MIEGLDRFDSEPYEPHFEAVAKAEREDVFSEVAFELLKDVGQTVSIAVSIEELDDRGVRIPMSRDAAILGALLVRCMKITHGLLQSAEARRMELVNLLGRPLIEAAVNLRFLIEQGTSEVFDDFIHYSFRTERRLRERIEAHVAEAGGEATPIQQRILRSISQALERAGVDVDADARPTGAWPQKIFDRFDRLGLGDQYLFQFVVQNHFMHGNWPDLDGYHLRVEDAGFVLDTTWGDVRPQPLLTATLVLAQATSQYLSFTLPESRECDLLIRRLEVCVARVMRVSEMYEGFLSREPLS